MESFIYSLFTFLSNSSVMSWSMVLIMMIMTVTSMQCSNLIGSSIKEHKSLFDEINKNKILFEKNNIYNNPYKRSINDFGKWSLEIGIKFNRFNKIQNRYVLAQVMLGFLLFYNGSPIKAISIVLASIFLFVITSLSIYYFYKKYMLPVLKITKELNEQL